MIILVVGLGHPRCWIQHTVDHRDLPASRDWTKSVHGADFKPIFGENEAVAL